MWAKELSNLCSVFPWFPPLVIPISPTPFPLNIVSQKMLFTLLISFIIFPFLLFAFFFFLKPLHPVFYLLNPCNLFDLEIGLLPAVRCWWGGAIPTASLSERPTGNNIIHILSLALSHSFIYWINIWLPTHGSGLQNKKHFLLEDKER